MGLFSTVPKKEGCWSANTFLRNWVREKYKRTLFVLGTVVRKSAKIGGHGQITGTGNGRFKEGVAEVHTVFGPLLLSVRVSTNTV